MGVFIRRCKSRIGYRLRKNRIKLLVVYIMLILSTLVFFFLYLTNRIYPYIKSVAVNYATQVANKAVNESVIAKISNNNYNKFITTEKSEDGRIFAFSANTMEFNKLKSNVLLESEKLISSFNSAELGIPIGNFTNNIFLFGRGPKISINIAPYGSSVVEFTNKFEEAGVNQTRHYIGMNIKTKIAVFLPVGVCFAEVVNTVPVAETVIIGDVPDNFTNFNGDIDDFKDGMLNKVGN